MGYSRQSYYARLEEEGRWRATIGMVLEAVRESRRSLPKSGYRQLMADNAALLAELGVGRDSFLGILRDLGLMQEVKRHGARTTFSGHGLMFHNNLLKETEVCRAAQVFVADITYIRTLEGFLYLALVTDSHTRKIVGWDASDSLELEGALRACRMAMEGLSKGLAKGLVHHSDHGAQYCSKAYVDYIRGQGALMSMGEVGNCYENAQAESVNGRLKVEFLLDATFPTKKAALAAVANGVKMYNTRRPHGKIGMQTPERFHESEMAGLARE
jgi:putative transposase